MISGEAQSAEISRFRQQVEEICRAHDVSFIFSPDRHVPYPSTGDLVNGYMVEYPRRQLAVAAGQPVERWLHVLVHESSHLDQYLEGSSYWTNGYIPGTTIEAVDAVTLWADHKIELTQEQLSEYVRRSRDAELDCERRAVTKAREFDLPVNVDEYTQKANSYIFFYTAIQETRAWYPPGKEPYNTPEVWSLCPTAFLADEAYDAVPADLMIEYRKLLR